MQKISRLIILYHWTGFKAANKGRQVDMFGAQVKWGEESKLENIFVTKRENKDL